MQFVERSHRGSLRHELCGLPEPGSIGSTNAGGNPAAAIDVDVSNDAIGGSGSPLGSANLVTVVVEFEFEPDREIGEPTIADSVVLPVGQTNVSTIWYHLDAF
jgi:hypothetical protein